MSIIVLDGYTMNPGDLSWEPLERLGPCKIYPRTKPEEAIARSRDAQAILTNKVAFDKAVIEALPNLRYIGVTATGYNIVDLEAAKVRGITVTNVPAYSTDSVAQAVFALLLELTNRTGEHATAVRAGKWEASPDFCLYLGAPTIELAGLTMGLVGFGNISRGVAKIAHAFGMKVLVSTRSPRKDLPQGMEACDLDSLFARSDIVSLHCPLTPETKGLVNAQRLAQMKRSAYLINTSRGPVVDDAALAAALKDGVIAGAGLDVLSVEPPQAGTPLLTAQNCVITPHIAWASAAARSRLMNAVISNLKNFLDGHPVNVVS